MMSKNEGDVEKLSVEALKLIAEKVYHGVGDYQNVMIDVCATVLTMTLQLMVKKEHRVDVCHDIFLQMKEKLKNQKD
jgi:hypothetical protein